MIVTDYCTRCCCTEFFNAHNFAVVEDKLEYVGSGLLCTSCNPEHPDNPFNVKTEENE